MKFKLTSPPSRTNDARKNSTLTFNGESDDGVITYDEDNNLFNLADTGITTTGNLTTTGDILSDNSEVASTGAVYLETQTLLSRLSKFKSFPLLIILQEPSVVWSPR